MDCSGVLEPRRCRRRLDRQGCRPDFRRCPGCFVTHRHAFARMPLAVNPLLEESHDETHVRCPESLRSSIPPLAIDLAATGCFEPLVPVTVPSQRHEVDLHLFASEAPSRLRTHRHHSTAGPFVIHCWHAIEYRLVERNRPHLYR